MSHPCCRPLFLCVLTPLLVCGVALAERKAKTPNAERPLLVGYFPQWGIYNDPRYLVKNLLPAGGRPLVDQINYAQGFVTGGHCSVADPNADLNFSFTSAQSVNGVADRPSQRFRGNLHQLQLLKRRFPKLRILISLEGRAADFVADAQPENREAFVRSCVDIFLRGSFAPGIHAPGIFDGIDVDWEYPHAADAENFEALLREFRRQMDSVRQGLILSIAAGHSPAMYEGTDMELIGQLVDQVGLMMYDFIGPWSGTTGFIAPLSSPLGHRGGSIDRSVTAYLDAGIPAKKILMGVPFYGYGWRQVADDDNGLFQEGQSIRGDRPYSYIASLISSSTVYRDPDSAAPWLFDGDSFWTYEDPVSIRRKAGYALERELGGLMVWELSEDDSSAVLLRAAWQGLHAINSEADAAAFAPSSGANVQVRQKPSTGTAP
ncbi:MAG TPA: glycosyl hydrolase family 18 protein [Edaphobacter sp.]